MKKFFSALLCLLILCTPVTAHAEAAPEIVSETAVVIDAGTGQVLYDKNMNRQMYPASITKVLTGAFGNGKRQSVGHRHGRGNGNSRNRRICQLYGLAPRGKK